MISGPNAGGKTVAAKAVGLAALARARGLHVPCAPGSALPLFDAVCAEIGDEQDLRAGLSTFSARMANLAAIAAQADARTLVIADEIGEGTEPGEGAALAQAILEALVERGALVLATTHFNRLKEIAGTDPRFANASAEFDPETLLPTFRIHLGQPGSSGAMWAAQRMGLDAPIVERARELMDREDSRLEALTRGLSELRQELEAERRLALRMREESEVARGAYETRLAALRGAREQALAAMKADLESAFTRARAEIAHVVRDAAARRRSEGAGGPRREPRAARAGADPRAHRGRRARAGRARAAPSRRAPIADAALVEGARVELAGVRSPALVLAAARQARPHRGAGRRRAHGRRARARAARAGARGGQGARAGAMSPWRARSSTSRRRSTATCAGCAWTRRSSAPTPRCSACSGAAAGGSCSSTATAPARCATRSAPGCARCPGSRSSSRAGRARAATA